MEILLNQKNFIVVYKEAGMPSQSDLTGDIDAMKAASEKLSSLGERSDLFLIHRLDRVVGGLLVFARNKRAAAELSRLVSGEGVGKEYLAVVDGECVGGDMTDLLYKDARAGKSFVVDRERGGVKLAELSYQALSLIESDRGYKTLVKIKLKTGRFHQIRCQFSSRGLPLTGDGKYGSKDNKAAFPSLFAYKLEFDLFGEKTQVKKLPDTDKYPWCLFDKSIYDEV